MPGPLTSRPSCALLERFYHLPTNQPLLASSRDAIVTLSRIPRSCIRYHLHHYTCCLAWAECLSLLPRPPSSLPCSRTPSCCSPSLPLLPLPLLLALRLRLKFGVEVESESASTRGYHAPRHLRHPSARLITLALTLTLARSQAKLRASVLAQPSSPHTWSVHPRPTHNKSTPRPTISS